MNTFLKYVLLVVILLTILYFVGPKPHEIDLTGTIPSPMENLIELENKIIHEELSNKFIKPNNEAQIIWANPSNKSKTTYSLLYLPGFSGSNFEAEPLHKEFGKRYGCNVFLARLQEHGMNKAEALLNFDGGKYLQSAREALSIAQSIGDKVIIMSTSTGSTLALILAAENPSIHALISYSPNIDLHDPRAHLLSGHWGLQIARVVEGSDYHVWNAGPGGAQYWNEKYRLESLVALKHLLDLTMTKDTFNKIQQPNFVGSWYENEEKQDDTVLVERIREMFSQLGAPSDKKTYKEYPADIHVIACKERSKSYDTVKNDTYHWVETTLALTPIENVESNLINKRQFVETP